MLRCAEEAFRAPRTSPRLAFIWMKVVITRICHRDSSAHVCRLWVDLWRSRLHLLDSEQMQPFWATFMKWNWVKKANDHIVIMFKSEIGCCFHAFYLGFIYMFFHLNLPPVKPPDSLHVFIFPRFVGLGDLSIICERPWMWTNVSRCFLTPAVTAPSPSNHYPPNSPPVLKPMFPADVLLQQHLRAAPLLFRERESCIVFNLTCVFGSPRLSSAGGDGQKPYRYVPVSRSHRTWISLDSTWPLVHGPLERSPLTKLNPP